MNRFFRMAIEIPVGIIKACVNNVFYGASISLRSAISPTAELQCSREGSTHIEEGFRLRSGCKVRCWKSGKLRIGKNVAINHGCIIHCRKEISIGDNVQLAPNVMLFDHDHDYKAEGGVKSMQYVEAPITIGNNVWVGANVVILRGTRIGDNSVIGAGSVVKGLVPSNTLYYDKRNPILQTII